MPSEPTACWVCRRDAPELSTEPSIERWLAREGETATTSLERIPIGPPDLRVAVPVCLVCQCLIEAVADRVVEAALRDRADATEVVHARAVTYVVP